jgi:hypothetical protein
MGSDAALDEINRIHDDQPERAAEDLRTLDTAALSAGKLPLAGFLLLHVLGEKLGRWDEAADRLEALLGTQDEAPLALLAHAAVGAQLAGRHGHRSMAELARVGGEAEAKLLVDLSALSWRPPPAVGDVAAELLRLARAAEAFDAAGPLNQRLAVGFNNSTSALLDQAPAPVAPAIAAALGAGAHAALRFWVAAGTWVNHERALYLQALVANRCGNPAAARDACRQALDVIDAHGTEAVDRTFLQLQLAGALLKLGDTAEGETLLAGAQVAAASWDDGLKSWFKEEHDRLFAGGEPH